MTQGAEITTPRRSPLRRSALRPFWRFDETRLPARLPQLKTTTPRTGAHCNKLANTTYYQHAPTAAAQGSRRVCRLLLRGNLWWQQLKRSCVSLPESPCRLLVPSPCVAVLARCLLCVLWLRCLMMVYPACRGCPGGCLCLYSHPAKLAQTAFRIGM